jgi:hypothetical protein
MQASKFPHEATRAVHEQNMVTPPTGSSYDIIDEVATQSDGRST